MTNGLPSPVGQEPIRCPSLVDTAYSVPVASVTHNRPPTTSPSLSCPDSSARSPWRPVRRSTCSIVWPSENQTFPAPHDAQLGDRPNFVVLTCKVLGSMRETVLSAWLLTQTAPAAGAMPVGLTPTFSVLVLFVRA